MPQNQETKAAVAEKCINLHQKCIILKVKRKPLVTCSHYVKVRQGVGLYLSKVITCLFFLHSLHNFWQSGQAWR